MIKENLSIIYINLMILKSELSN